MLPNTSVSISLAAKGVCRYLKTLLLINFLIVAIIHSYEMLKLRSSSCFNDDGFWEFE